MPVSFVRCGKSDAACGVNCHKSCRSRLAVECRKRTKSISHETPPALQARSYSFPPPANSPPSLQDTGEKLSLAAGYKKEIDQNNMFFFIFGIQMKYESCHTTTLNSERI
ncbi:hypothetical protein CHARACLAT_009505 [Characodon lateralis]|uniref:Phorbol-ester/DAG-type domain-containing protein n=1 Tax=Characodon lateralis TaxID=208331 RepID=A0ABU7EBD9_9TELE|nr:hypothetical protein [Characodon lateralis]